MTASIFEDKFKTAPQRFRFWFRIKQRKNASSSRFQSNRKTERIDISVFSEISFRILQL